MRTSRKTLTAMANCHRLIWEAKVVLGTTGIRLHPLVWSHASVVRRACKSFLTKAAPSNLSNCYTVVREEMNKISSKARIRLWWDLLSVDVTNRLLEAVLSSPLNISPGRTKARSAASRETTASPNCSCQRSEVSAKIATRSGVTHVLRDLYQPVQISIISSHPLTRRSWASAQHHNRIWPIWVQIKSSISTTWLTARVSKIEKRCSRISRGSIWCRWTTIRRAAVNN